MHATIGNCCWSDAWKLGLLVEEKQLEGHSINFKIKNISDYIVNLAKKETITRLLFYRNGAPTEKDDSSSLWFDSQW